LLDNDFVAQETSRIIFHETIKKMTKICMNPLKYWATKFFELGNEGLKFEEVR